MLTWFVSRHGGAIDWIKQIGIPIDRFCHHLSEVSVAPGDVVMGTLPVHMAAQVCAQGAYFFELVIDLPESFRGRELDKDALLRFNARLVPFMVVQTESKFETILAKSKG